MKIKLFLNVIYITALLSIFSSDTFSITRLVSVQDIVFTLANLNITVGDTMRYNGRVITNNPLPISKFIFEIN